MNINDLTLGQAKELVKLMGNTPSEVLPHPFVGRYVILRCYSAGVHAGILVSQNGDQAVLRDSRRLWNWEAAQGVALSGVAQYGLRSGCKIDVINPEIALTGVIETIPTSAMAQASIHDY